jgi:hypothetical protein
MATDSSFARSTTGRRLPVRHLWRRGDLELKGDLE